MKICSRCKIPQNLDNFCNNKNNIDKKQNYCKTCAKGDTKKYIVKPENKAKSDKYNSERRKQARQFIISFKQDNSCKKCGESRWYVLDFHHIDPNVKEHMISNMVTRGNVDKIQKEIDKCILLCRNCHSEFHFLEKINSLKIEEYLK